MEAGAPLSALRPAELVAFTRLQTAKTFFDPTPSRLALGYGKGGLAQALVDTVKACMGGWGTPKHAS